MPALRFLPRRGRVVRREAQLARYEYVRHVLRECGHLRVPRLVPPRIGRRLRHELGIAPGIEWQNLMEQVRILEAREDAERRRWER